MTVAELVDKLEDYGDHLPVYIDTFKGPLPVEEVGDEVDSLVNDGAPFVLLLPK